MAGREKKPLSHKQLGVRKEIDKTVKVTETTKEDEVKSKIRESKQVQKDVNQGKKSALKKRSTGGIKSRKSLEAIEITVKDTASSAVDPVTGGKPARSSQNPKLHKTSKLNKTRTSQSGTNLANELFSLSNDTKRSQSPRLCKTNKVAKGGKQGSRTSEETNLSDDSNLNTLTTKVQSPKLRRFATQNKLLTGSPDVRNGARGRNTPYITRSDSPARVLRNGKRRKLKDPSLLEGLDVRYPKRRRLLSATRDGSGSELGSKSEPCLDDQSSIAGSDISVYDFPRLENGKGSWDSDFDSKVPVDATKSEELSTHGVHSSSYSESQSETSHDSCLGKSISNKIAELIHRNKFLESIGKELVPKTEEKVVSSKLSEPSETNLGKFIENEKNLTDTNFNLCGSESVPSEKTISNSTENQPSHDCSTQDINLENEVSETKERVSHILPSARKVTAQDNADLKEMGHKNGQNLSIDIALYHLREKSTRKVRDLKVMKSKKLFQECPSSSGVFYVVQNPSNVSVQKEGDRSFVTPSIREDQSPITCSDAHLVSQDAVVLNSSAEEKLSAEFENIASIEGGTSNVPVGDVVEDTLNVCTGLQQEKESTFVLSQTIDEADVLGVKNDTVHNVNLACKEKCVSDFSVDMKECNSIDCEKDSDSKVDSDIKDDSNTVILDSKVDCESVVIKADSKNSVELSSMECENTASHDVETDMNGSGRVVIDNNDPASTTNSDTDYHVKTVSNEDCVMGMSIKNCKETVSAVDIVDHTETVNNTSSAIDCKEISYSVGGGNDCNNTTDKPQRPVLPEVSEISDHKVKTALERVIHADCESDASEGGRSIRRSTRSSRGRVRAAMLHCITAGKTKSTKLGLQEKSQDAIKDEVESFSVCLTEESSNMGSEDATFSSQTISEDSEEIKEVESKEDPVVAEANSLHKAEDLSLTTSTTVLKIQSVPSRENDIYVKEGDKELSEEKGNSVYVDELVIGKENETCETNLDIKVLKESIVEPEVTAEKQIILVQEKKQRILEPRMDTSDVIDFAKVGSENSVSNEDLSDTKPTAKKENENISNEDSFVVESIVKAESTLNIESNSKLENETDNKLPMQSKFMSEIVTHVKKDKVDCIGEVKDDKKDDMNDVDEGQVHKLQNSIEPSLFYSKEVKSCDSEHESSDDIVKGSESDISESQCDSKDQHASSSAKEEFSSCIPRCSSEVGQASDSSKSFPEEVFQMNVEQCDKISEEHSEHILSDVNSILHSVSQFEVGESLHEVSNSIDGSMVGSSRHLDAGGNDSKVTDSENTFLEEDVSPEEQAIKESVLSALGLQPLRATQGGVAASGSCRKTYEGNYTGTLKTVIKLQRSSPEKRRTPLKLVLKHGKAHSSVDEPSLEKGEDEFEDLDFDEHGKIEYSICKEAGTSENTKDPHAFGIGNRKCLKPAYSYRYFDISSNPQFLADKSSPGDRLSPEISSKDDGKAQSTKQSGNLVIPEKSSSFSIHPGRLCSDVCSYCFGKFGSLDTPCHIAQLKSSERQQKILQAETHLTADSCLCDACYRHVDRKANCPSYKPNKKRQHHRSVSSQIKTPCCVRGCSQIAEHHVRRKWLIKLKRSIAKKVQIDMDKMPQHLPFPLCLTHYTWIDYFMVCGICKRRLTRNHMYPLGPEVHELNMALESDGIPAHLSDKLFVCKLCRYFSSVRLKYKDPSQLAENQKLFYQGYRKRLLQYHNIEEEMDEETAEEASPKQKRRKTKASTSTAVKVDGEDDSGTKSKCELTSQSENQHLADAFGPATIDFSSLGDVSIDRSGASTPMIDYSSLGNGTSNSNLILFDDIGSSRKQTLKLERVKPRKLKVKLGSSKIGNLSYSQSEERSGRSILLPERDGLEVTPVHDSLSRPFYPGEEELPLHANFEFHGRKEEETPNNRRGEWEKCTATIQFDKDTKSLFQQLQRPYGNHSSFFRHLILLEKYWRSGELILAPCASSRAMNYVNSVQNRIHAYEGHPSIAHLSSPCSSSPHLSSTTSATSVPVIDLPLKRRLGGGILTASDGSMRPVTITRMSGVSISPRPVTFTSVSSAIGVSSSQSRMPVFTSFPQNSPSPAPQKVIMDTVATSTASHFQQNRRIPNVLQVTAGGKSFSIVPGLTQIRHIQAFKQQQHQFQREQQQERSCFEPMICDVRSLATENGSDLWDQNVTQHSGKSSQKPNISVSLLPKTSTGTTFKSSTIVTPTGIILSRKPEISVTAVAEKKDVTLKPKAISGKRNSVSKVKPLSEKLDLIKAKAVLEKKEIVLQTAVSELKDNSPQTKC